MLRRDDLSRAAILLCIALPLSVSALPRLTDPLSLPLVSASAVAEEGPSRFKLAALQFGAGAGAALVAVPASLGLAIWLGSLSNNLILAAVPAVVAFVALPPLAVTFAAAWAGNLLAPGSSRVSPAIWATLGTQLLVLASAILLNVHGPNLGDAAILVLVEALVLPAAAVGTMRIFPPAGVPPQYARRPAQDPSRPAPHRLPSLPVVSWTF